MTHRALIFGLLVAVAQAGDPPEVIDSAALEAPFKELQTRYEQVKKGALPLDEFVLYYQQQAQAKGTPRQRAIAAFFYGFVLNNIAPKTKEGKDAKREVQRAIDLAPGMVDAYAELAVIAERAGDRTEAERLLRRSLEIQPTFVRAIIQLGNIAKSAGELDRAKGFYEQSLEVQATVEALYGLVRVNTRLFQSSYDEKAKERLAREALAAADAMMTLEPDSALYLLLKAETFLNLGRVEEAVDFLETHSANEALKPYLKAEVLKLLREVYQAKGNVEGVTSAIERLLKCEAVKPEERAHYTGRLKDVQDIGRFAFIKWGIEDATSVLRNEGLSVEQRLTVLLRLQEFITSEALDVPQLRPLVLHAWRECFRILVDGPPELVVAQLRALRNGRPPARLMAVLVHFVYPNGKTDEVREDGVRTVAAAGGAAAIPAIYFSLQDASGRVVRECDSQLAVLCERRSPLGGSMDAFTDEQRRQALRTWTTYFHSEEGAQRLAKAFTDLSNSILRVEPDRTSAPMIDHAAHVILDGDVPWIAWAAAYDFLVKYWGKDFRPVERRGTPVEPGDREPICAAFEKDYAATEEPAPPPGKAQQAPAGAMGK